MKGAGLSHAFDEQLQRGASWVPTEKNATLDHVFVSRDWRVTQYAA
jgi:hypothetical protein